MVTVPACLVLIRVHSGCQWHWHATGRIGLEVLDDRQGFKRVTLASRHCPWHYGPAKGGFKLKPAAAREWPASEWSRAAAAGHPQAGCQTTSAVASESARRHPGRWAALAEEYE